MVASLRGDNLQVYCYLCASEIWPNNWSGHVWLYKNGITVHTHTHTCICSSSYTSKEKKYSIVYVNAFIDILK